MQAKLTGVLLLGEVVGDVTAILLEESGLTVGVCLPVVGVALLGVALLGVEVVILEIVLQD